MPISRPTGGSRRAHGRSTSAVSLGYGFLPESLPAPIRDFLLSAAPANPDAFEPLWRAVIARAVSDALGHVIPIATNTSRGPAERERIVAEARAWFERGGDDFEMVCAMASLDSGKMRDLMLAAIRLDEQCNGIVTASPPMTRGVSRYLNDMPGVAFSVIRAPKKPIVVEKIRRRVSREDREASAVVFSYVSRTARSAVPS